MPCEKVTWRSGIGRSDNESDFKVPSPATSAGLGYRSLVRIDEDLIQDGHEVHLSLPSIPHKFGTCAPCVHEPVAIGDGIAAAGARAQETLAVPDTAEALERPCGMRTKTTEAFTPLNLRTHRDLRGWWKLLDEAHAPKKSRFFVTKNYKELEQGSGLLRCARPYQVRAGGYVRPFSCSSQVFSGACVVESPGSPRAHIASRTTVVRNTRARGEDPPPHHRCLRTGQHQTRPCRTERCLGPFFSTFRIGPLLQEPRTLHRAQVYGHQRTDLCSTV